MSDLLTALLAARALIATEATFTPYQMAVSAHGKTISPQSRQAARWDAYGALCRASGTDWRLEQVGRAALKQAAAEMGYAGPCAVCEQGGWKAALAMIDRAIQEASQ